MPRKTWTVRAKRHINGDIDAGFTIQVTTPSDYPDSNALERALKAIGIQASGCLSKEWWDWF